MSKTVVAVDLFAGSGGTSTGLSQACAAAGLRLNLTAINHWDVAIESHAANHPDARHLCQSLDAVEPSKLFRKLDLLVASPECVHFSNARGGKPCDDQNRASAWHVVRWAEALRPLAILVENVREFMSWGALNDKGRPLERKKGETFQAWLSALQSLGYRTSYRVVCAADHGDATTRERLFVLAVRGRAEVRWPEPSHAKDGGADLFGAKPRWKAAREIIDWGIKGESIFTRKRPLKEKTLARIEAGLRRFGGDAFLAQFKGTHPSQLPSTAQSADAPLGTVTAQGGSFGVCEPFLVPYRGERQGQEPRNHSLDEPAPTLTTVGGHALIQPFLMQMSQTGSNGPRMRSADAPIPTVTTADDLAFVMHATHHGERRTHPVSEPLPTVTGANRGELAFVLGYYGNGGNVHPLGEPLPTVTTLDRFALIEVCRRAGIDILFRMLQPHELAAAHSFPKGYVFKGNRGDQVRQVGNSVPVKVSEALCRSLLAA